MFKLAAVVLVCLSFQFVSARWVREKNPNKYETSDGNSRSVEILVEPLTADAERRLEQQFFNQKLLDKINRNLEMSKTIVTPAAEKVQKKKPVKRHCVGTLSMLICV